MFFYVLKNNKIERNSQFLSEFGLMKLSASTHDTTPVFGQVDQSSLLAAFIIRLARARAYTYSRTLITTLNPKEVEFENELLFD